MGDRNRDFRFYELKIGLAIDGRDAQNATETIRIEDCHTGNGTQEEHGESIRCGNSIGNRI